MHASLVYLDIWDIKCQEKTGRSEMCVILVSWYTCLESLMDINLDNCATSSKIQDQHKTTTCMSHMLLRSRNEYFPCKQFASVCWWFWCRLYIPDAMLWQSLNTIESMVSPSRWRKQNHSILKFYFQHTINRITISQSLGHRKKQKNCEMDKKTVKYPQTVLWTASKSPQCSPLPVCQCYR